MKLARWIRTAFGTRPTALARKRRPARRLAVECLEDRTTPSAVPLTDANQGAIGQIVPVGSSLYFVADDGVSGPHLWRTNGQPGGATAVESGGKPLLTTDVSVIAAAGSWVYFFTNDGGGDSSLWRYDTGSSSSQAEFVRFIDSGPEGGSGLPYGLTAVGGDVFYTAYSGVSDGYELNRTGGESGTTTVFDLWDGTDSSWPYRVQVSGSRVYVNADDADGLGLFAIDAGASEATRVPTTPGISPYMFKTAAVGTDLYYLGSDIDANRTAFGLWRLTNPQTAPEFIKPLYGASEVNSYSIALLTATDSAVYFVERDIAEYAPTAPWPGRSYSLWKCEGSTPTLIKSFSGSDPNFIQSDGGFVPLQIASVGTDVYVSDQQLGGLLTSGGYFGARLWRTDGTPGSAELVTSYGVPGFVWLTPVGSELYFGSGDALLWRTTGTAAGAEPFDDPPLGVDVYRGGWNYEPFGWYNYAVPFSNPIAAVGSTTFFAGTGSTSGLWRLNAAPVAAEFAATADQDTPATVAVLAHVTDADSIDLPHLSASLVSGPTHGTLSLNAGGSFTYTPAVGYSGPDSFTYQASDGIDPSTVATVAITVLPRQVTVTSEAAGGDVTLEAPAGTGLAAAAVIDNPSPADAPADAQFPLGFFTFEVHGVAVGGATTVTLSYPAGVTVNTYYMYGPTSDNATPHWYEFLYDNTTGTGAVIDSANHTITLHFVDGQRGDHDLTVNGVVVDPGTPALKTLQVQIDVRSSVNLASQGQIAVAIFSTADFDARLVDAATVRFAGAAAVQWFLQDVDGDGRLDLVLNFRTEDTDLADMYRQLLIDDADGDGVLDSTRQTATVYLTGSTTDDLRIEGSDTIDLFLSGKALRALLADLAAAGAI